MRLLITLLLAATSVTATPITDVINVASETHGLAGETAARFLLSHMPERDKASLDGAFIAENLNLAFRARAEFSWAAKVPENLFLNDVLPYAVLNETRENWRPRYFELAREIVKDAETATDAAQALNRELFNEINVHYDTGRKKPNQSPAESEAQSKATCTGLSIILVDALRAIGIPARIAGTPLWSNGRGNHTWVEFWDGGWCFLGADEYDAQGVNRGWFVADAARGKEHDPRHAIYATSWKKTGTDFPMVWAPLDESVHGVNVTARYARGTTAPNHRLGFRLLNAKGQRVAVRCALVDENGQRVSSFTTKADQTDLNDLPETAVTPGLRYRLRVRDRQTKLFTATKGVSTMAARPADFTPISASLSKTEAAAKTREEHARLVEETREERQRELDAKTIELDGKELKWEARILGKAPQSGRSLWISMHGGGGAAKAVNDAQWRNQINLYTPEEGIYIAPRAPTDSWNMWHQAHIDRLFDRLIQNHVALCDVDPDKIYVMGYSAGGDGVWQLAPRMADRFAAAAMMAGHPNESSLLGLRNLPFALFMGENDAAYKRNFHALEKTKHLAKHRKEDPEGYAHLSRIYEGLGHWMNGKDREAIPWMADFCRDPWPRKIVWFQDDVTHDRFYWLKIPKGAAAAGQRIAAAVEDQRIHLTGDVPQGLRVRLSDRLLDLDRPIEIWVNGEQRFAGTIKRNDAIIQKTLEERLDLPAAACAEVVLYW